MQETTDSLARYKLLDQKHTLSPPHESPRKSPEMLITEEQPNLTDSNTSTLAYEPQTKLFEQSKCVACSGGTSTGLQKEYFDGDIIEQTMRVDFKARPPLHSLVKQLNQKFDYLNKTSLYTRKNLTYSKMRCQTRKQGDRTHLHQILDQHSVEKQKGQKAEHSLHLEPIILKYQEERDQETSAKSEIRKRVSLLSKKAAGSCVRKEESAQERHEADSKRRSPTPHQSSINDKY